MAIERLHTAAVDGPGRKKAGDLLKAGDCNLANDRDNIMNKWQSIATSMKKSQALLVNCRK